VQVKIDEIGVLWVMRKNKFKKVICPYTGRHCSDDCALFHEPVPTFTTPSYIHGDMGCEDGIELAHGCGAYIICLKNDFTDERC